MNLKSINQIAPANLISKWTLLLLHQNVLNDSKCVADTQPYATNHVLETTLRIDEELLNNSWANMYGFKYDKLFTDSKGGLNYEPIDFQLVVSKSRKKKLKQKSKTKQKQITCHKDDSFKPLT